LSVDRLTEKDERSSQVAVVARLKEGTEARARELVSEGPPFDPRQLGFNRLAVYLSPGEVIFHFEGRGAAQKLADVIDDMVVSASFSAWAPLLEGIPKLAHESYFWEAETQSSGPS
jgi:hypothetical protein